MFSSLIETHGVETRNEVDSGAVSESFENGNTAPQKPLNYLTGRTDYPKQNVDEQTVQDIIEIYKKSHEKLTSHAQKAIPFTVQEIAHDPMVSKIGGQPYYPEGYDTPQDDEGNPLFFLAQINMEDVASNYDIHPDLKTGLLQFYVGTDDLMGCQFPSSGPNVSDYKVAQSSSQFRVIHIPKNTPLIARQNEEFTDADPFSYPDSKINSKQITPNSVCYLYPENTYIFDIDPYVASLNKLKETDPSITFTHPLVTEFEEENLDIIKSNNTCRTDVHFGGHPFFRQEDYRDVNSFRTHTFPLLSMGGVSKNICIGDVGELHFMIDPENLKKGDLTDISYNWDCF
jgi:uncharacterized protein YwqG